MVQDDLVNYSECIMVREGTKDYVPLILYSDTFDDIISVDEITPTKIFITVTNLHLVAITSIARTLLAGNRTTFIVGNTYYVQMSKVCKDAYVFIDTKNGEYFSVYNYTIKTFIKENKAVEMRISDTLRYKLVDVNPKEKLIVIQLRC